MVARIFIAMQAIKQAFFYQVILNVFLIIAIWAFTRQHGEYGYPYGVILVNCINFIGMYFICKKYFKAIEYGRLLKYSAKMMVINLSLAALLFYGLLSIDLSSLYKLLFGSIIYLALFIFMLKVKGFGFYETIGQQMKKYRYHFLSECVLFFTHCRQSG